MTDGPRLRFAPSPTGPLHIGGARTAIYNWAAARAMGGTFLLRIEDTDRARSTDESLRIILEGLRWLGVDWDEGPEKGGDHGPYFQTQRLDLYARYAERLLADGHAYRCYATPEEVAEGRQAMLEKVGRSMYDRRHRDLTDAQRAAFEAEGRRPSLRFRMPLEGRVALRDLSKGELELDYAELDDWVMVRPDGMPTYNFACVVDDAEMKISHVLRGDEHAINGFKQSVLFRALGLEPPQYAHIPLILDRKGKKLSKREATTNLLDYRDQGYPADAVFNYISLLGWGFSGDRDIFSRREMVERFRIESIGKAGARFDSDKLLALCGHYVRAAAIDDLVASVRPFLEAAGVVPVSAFDSHPGLLRNAVGCYQERIRLYAEMAPALAWVFADVEPDDAARKSLAKYQDAPDWLAAYAGALEATELPPSYPAERGVADDAVRLPSGKEGAPPPSPSSFATPSDLEQQARELADRLGVKFGHFVHPVRAALTGTNKGPGLFDVVYLLGKGTCLRRLRAHAGRP